MTTFLFDSPVDPSGPGDVLEITLRFEGDVTVCVLEGSLCAYTAPSLQEWLTQLHDNDRNKVIVDGRRVTSLSSDGVDLLHDHAARCRGAGGALQVRAPSGVVRRVLEVCGADDLVEPDATAG